MIAFRQRIRIRILRLIAVVFLTLSLLLDPILDDTFAGDVMEQAGVLLVFAGVLGRLWSILYIGGHKNRRVIKSGPYSICQHPLYLGSSIATLGFGLMLQSLVFALILTVTVFLIHSWTARREEAFLRHAFGAEYAAYAAVTPRILPNLRRFQTAEDVTFSVSHLKTNFFDALGFVMLIPLAEMIDTVREERIIPGFPIL